MHDFYCRCRDCKPPVPADRPIERFNWETFFVFILMSTGVIYFWVKVYQLLTRLF